MSMTAGCRKQRRAASGAATSVRAARTKRPASRTPATTARVFRRRVHTNGEVRPLSVSPRGAHTVTAPTTTAIGGRLKALSPPASTPTASTRLSCPDAHHRLANRTVEPGR